MNQSSESNNLYFKFFKEIYDKFSDKKYLSRNDKIKIIEVACNYGFISPIRSKLIPYFSHNNVIADILRSIHGSPYLNRIDREEINKYYLRINESHGKDTTSLKIMAPGGIYPNKEIKRNGVTYTFYNQLPILINKKRRLSGLMQESSIIHWLSRQELKFFTSIICAPKHTPFPLLNITHYNSIAVEDLVLENIPQDEQLDFLMEYMSIKNRFLEVGNEPFTRKRNYDVSDYKFIDFTNSLNDFRKIYDSFSITDELLLRTSNNFIKGRIHSNNYLTFEEAIANNFICLEGCLHLIQKKHGDNHKKLNLKLLEGVFHEHINYGENIFEFIKEGYEKRISLLHPEPVWGAEWDPWITYDDYTEYFGINRMLLRYILINDNSMYY